MKNRVSAFSYAGCMPLRGCFGTGPQHEFILSVTCALQPPPSTIATVQRVSTEYMQMMAYVISEGRLFGLKPSEWSLMLVGVALCGLMTLLF
jgi:hypothetical protein